MNETSRNKKCSSLTISYVNLIDYSVSIIIINIFFKRVVKNVNKEDKELRLVLRDGYLMYTKNNYYLSSLYTGKLFIL